MTEPADPFLDVTTLLERSIPRPQAIRFAFPVGILLLMLLLGIASGSSAVAAPVAQLISFLGTLLLIAAMGVLAFFTARTVQREQQEMQATEELIQLRRWDQAAILLDNILSRPARSLQSRVQLLLYLAAVLARYDRYADAIAVYDHLLELDYQDNKSVHALRLGRAMSLLHDDRLYDADRAINELRRDSSASESGGLALVEIYRDVKTGHPQDALNLFCEKLPLLRRQLSHRVADAYALIARAYDLLDQPAEAKSAYESATLLTPQAELHRRYSEVVALASRYQPAQIPPEAT